MMGYDLKKIEYRKVTPFAKKPGDDEDTPSSDK